LTEFALARARTKIRLGQELGRGGEGAVLEIEGRPKEVAKIYSAPPDPRKVQKLLAMAQAATSSLAEIAAWPADILLDGSGTARGFLMPRVTARRDIHELYSPKSRGEAFPEADLRFLVHAAANIARAFAVIHEHDHVIGDVNHGNLLVGPDGTVVLIDCDSFQIRNGAHFYTCDVGVPLFTPPELQGRPFRGLERTANHDRFGLAVLLFHLVYMGRHPFAGRYSGSGEMPIERAIAEFRFAYGPDRASNGMERPPGTIPLETMGDTVARLFARAFGRTGSAGGRPEPRAWIAALESLKASLRRCPQANWHHYPQDLASCPWCVVEAQTGARLFGLRVEAIGVTGLVDVSALWRAIAAVPDPGGDPALPSERPWMAPSGITNLGRTLKVVRHVLSICLVCAGLVACNALAKDERVGAAIVLYGLGVAVWPRVSAEKRQEADRASAAARAQWDSGLARWKREATRGVFATKLKTLEQARTELDDLPNERRRRLAKLEGEREIRQRDRYLDRFRIERARVRGIGPSRTAMLASYGVETAADVDPARIGQIPGFGWTLTSELVAWRRAHERDFRFNPRESVDPREVNALDRDLEMRRQNLMSALRQGPAELGRLAQEIRAARQRLMPTLDDSWTALKSATIRRESL
jgi:DNA-binding helix-hairpin-helix protein with protein kinase domain